MPTTKKQITQITHTHFTKVNKIYNIDLLTAKGSWFGVCISVCSLTGNVGVDCGWTIDDWAVATWGDWTTFGCNTPAIGWLGTT